MSSNFLLSLLRMSDAAEVFDLTARGPGNWTRTYVTVSDDSNLNNRTLRIECTGDLVMMGLLPAEETPPKAPPRGFGN